MLLHFIIQQIKHKLKILIYTVMKYIGFLKPHLLAITFFAFITLIYFSPLFEGKDVQQSDMVHAAGMSHELVHYHDTSGKYAQWTNAMFSGMPAYHVGPYAPNYNIFSYLASLTGLYLPPASAGIVMAMLICFYLLLFVTGASPWIAVAGAVAYAFSAYNFIIIGAGHVTKAWALAYVPLIIAGIWLLYHRKYTAGFLLSLLGIGLNISKNHVQITYYTLFIVVFLILGFLAEAIRSKELKPFIRASLLLIAATLIALLPNATMLYTNYEISKTSIRGPSELSHKEDSRKGKGLDKTYAFDWSYGITESFSVLIPNIKGGASGSALDTRSELYKTLQQYGVSDAKKYIQQVPTYWGDMPFTSGPAYHGAIICFLFVLGLFILKNRIKWWLLATTILSFFLAWGRNFSAFNDLMFYYFPMYSKFRTVSMALVIAQFTMPFLGIMALWEFLSHPEDRSRLLKGLKWSFLITGGLCLFFVLFGGSLFDFTAPGDAQIKAQVPEWYYTALLADRAAMLRADAFRSFVFIALAAGLLWIALNRTQYLRYVLPAFVVLILADMWPVAKRYLNNEHFVKKNKKYEFIASTADKYILQDNDPSYRVLNLNNPFNEVYTSYFHKSIGGYHGAKQRRYQELIEHHLQPEISAFINSLQRNFTPSAVDSALKRLSVLNMLNTRYIIYNPEAPPLRNPYALGNAWFASRYQLVDNADEEMQKLGEIDLRNTALIDKRFAHHVEGFTPENDSMASIRLIKYEPNRLVYEYTTSKPQLTLFSEVYYPRGWEARVDGKLIPHFRANWILRAMILPEGKHRLEYVFVPRPLYMAQKTTLAGSILTILLMAGVIVMNLKNKDKKEN